MVEYSFDEAIELLETQLTNAYAKIQELEEDLYFLRGNSITVEVNMARLFNYSVKQRKMKESSHVPSPAVAANQRMQKFFLYGVTNKRMLILDVIDNISSLILRSNYSITLKTVDTDNTTQSHLMSLLLQPLPRNQAP